MAAGRGSVDRAVATLQRLAADVIALQEVEASRRSGTFQRQAAGIGEALGMQAHFEPALQRRNGDPFGNAVLSRLPMRVVAGGALPRVPLALWREPRVVTWVALTTGAAELQVLVTHLGLHRRERLAQVEALLGPAWLGDPRCALPRVLLGDLNCRPGSPEHRLLEGALVDALLVAPPREGAATFPARRPLVRLDHVLVSADVRVLRSEIPRGRELRRVSDHLPVVVDLELPG